jgi:hypothetical protein
LIKVATQKIFLEIKSAVVLTTVHRLPVNCQAKRLSDIACHGLVLGAVPDFCALNCQPLPILSDV